ncbi:hypothetical protein X566_07590 [Afipia sp. P52-10]|jgi:Mg-chelatase subunit ChlI|uniref:hypothetical protein n=1 Tax=Afipia sp. P52-10 TaxID=1429916 RepID=UPI0003DF28DB|nr:hypothetical protein [Afipia sp. P52-10]ETR77513.1 hypothetical protein X566_07590 [Afipia sp. P52-10]
MRILLLAIMLIITAAPAFAQLEGATGIPLNPGGKQVSPEEQEKRRATEDAYKRTMKQIPDAKPLDPWGNMRASDTPAGGQTKSHVKKQTKTSTQAK